MIKDFENFVSGINEYNRRNIDDLEKGECFTYFRPGDEPIAKKIRDEKKNGLFLFFDNSFFNLYFYDDIEEVKAKLFKENDDKYKDKIEKIMKKIGKLNLGESFMEKIDGEYAIFTKFYEK